MRTIIYRAVEHAWPLANSYTAKMTAVREVFNNDALVAIEYKTIDEDLSLLTNASRVKSFFN
jgi:hypothetical protein